MRLRIVFDLLVLGLATCAALGAVFGSWLPAPLRAALVLVAFLLLLVLAFRLLRRFLWSVGRRLAFSYFLIGVLPIPLVALLGLVAAYIGTGFFLGYLFRDAVDNLHGEVTEAAATQLVDGRSPTAAGGDRLLVARYAGGSRVGDAAWAPEAWPEWLLQPRPEAARDQRNRPAVAPSPFAMLPDGSPTLAAAAGNAANGVVVALAGDVEEEISDRTGIWVRLLRPDDPQHRSTIRLQVANRHYTLHPLGGDRSLAAPAHFTGEGRGERGLLDRALLWWGELSEYPRALASGEPAADYLGVSLNATPKSVMTHLLSGSSDVDTAAWATMLAVTSLLSLIYLAAALMAVFLIVGLSRAVNRLSRATAAIQTGDFSVRIPGRRRDQIGELQRTFNDMSAGLERAVATRAHQEALEAELALARRLQESLLPDRMPSSDILDFATLFEPSAAIGGDYFDVLRLDEARLAIVIADVSGHGLPSGLRMAMLKAALGILVEERKGTEEILRRLDAMVRAEQPRYFITCTISVVDFERGHLEMTNAGHPPTYLVRDDEAREILLPGSPLGALGTDYGRKTLDLEPGDVLVWLSDGLIEASNAGDDAFGYERVRLALGGPTPSAAVVRDRLLRAVAAHAGGRAVDDDQTVVVLRYRG